MADQFESRNGNATTAPPNELNSLRRGQVWAIAVVAGLVAGVVAWLASEPLREVFKPQLFPIRVALTTFIQPTAASLNAADIKNGTVVFTILGAVTGLTMGIAGGLARRSAQRALTVGLSGLVAGALVGAGASWGLLPLFFRRSVPDPNDLLSPVLIHGGIWIAIGAVGGAAFGLGMRCGRRLFDAIVGACLCALVATLVFHGLGEALFPDSGATSPVAASAGVRLLAVFLVSFLSAIGAARGALGRASQSAKTYEQVEA
jgi:hypothetical protein